MSRMLVRNTPPRKPFLLRHPWIGALALGTAATVVALVLAMLKPRGLGLVLGWPLLVLMDWIGPGYNVGTAEEPFYEGTPVHVIGMLLEVGLVWLYCLLLARVTLWRVAEARRERDVRS